MSKTWWAWWIGGSDLPTSEERLATRRIAFWAALAEAAPDLRIDPGGGWEETFALGLGGDLRVTLSLSQDKSSVYLVGRADPARAWIAANKTELAKRLRTTVGTATGEAGKGRWFRNDNPKACFTLQRQWPEANRWLRAQHASFAKAVAETRPD